MAIQLFELAGAEQGRVFSPYCWRICMALAHKGLGWETLPWRFHEKARIAPFDSTTVPVLVDGEQAVADSWKIALYLDEAYPECPPLFGCDAARGEALLIKFWTERTLHPFITRMTVRDILDVLDEKDRTYFRESREKRLGRQLEAVVSDREQTREGFRAALDPLRATLASQPFIGGESPNFADYTVFGMFMWARAVSPFPLLADDDPVHAWRARLLAMYDGLAARAVGFDV
ncbi:MAG: glutathione S-transferase family protein [Betaproteobacteria bacterium]|nr:glutathione S-transferase family protein [Betaproteobacteria bacterium]